jgi:hypothetical protein
LITAVLEVPETAERTTVRFVTRRMRSAQRFDRVPEFIDVAERMPHAADILARLFRESGHWSDLGGWLVEYASSDWAVSEWSVAQFATMFPSDHDAPEAVFQFLADRLSTDSSLPMLAVAAQRLAAWDPAEARVRIRDRADSAAHPLERRLLALAAVAADDEPAFVRGILAEFEENAPTLAMRARVDSDRSVSLLTSRARRRPRHILQAVTCFRSLRTLTMRTTSVRPGRG